MCDYGVLGVIGLVAFGCWVAVKLRIGKRDPSEGWHWVEGGLLPPTDPVPLPIPEGEGVIRRVRVPIDGRTFDVVLRLCPDPFRSERLFEPRDDTVGSTIFVGPVPGGFGLRRQGFGDTVMIGGNELLDLATGDQAFDRAVVVSGEAARLRAALDHRVRAEVMAFVAGEGMVEAGSVRIPASALDARPGADGFPVDARGPLRLARSLSVSDAELPDRLAALALEDPVPQVRARALAQLALTAPARVAQEIDAVLDDVDAGPVAVALGLLDPTREPTALRFLADPRPPARRAAIAWLGRHGSVGAVEALGDLGGEDARAAILAIQARLGPVDAGRVTVAQGGGEVALAGGGDVALAAGAAADDRSVLPAAPAVGGAIARRREDRT